MFLTKYPEIFNRDHKKWFIEKKWMLYCSCVVGCGTDEQGVAKSPGDAWKEACNM